MINDFIEYLECKNDIFIFSSFVADTLIIICILRLRGIVQTFCRY